MKLRTHDPLTYLLQYKISWTNISDQISHNVHTSCTEKGIERKANQVEMYRN